MVESRAPSYVDGIIEKFGRAVDLARALNHQNVTTVQGWRERGVIPARQQSRVLDAARRLGIDVQPADFFIRCNHSSRRGEAA